MKGLITIDRLGYLIQSIWQDAPGYWHVCFRSPFEWELWQAEGSSLFEAATNAAKIAKRRGPALEASAAYRARVAARFAKHRVRLSRKRVRL